ncbi:MAG: toll/interleukin-1 receptor domain-containing protein [Leptolyngbyaceae cyanobacterium]
MNSSATTASPLKVFVSYSHKDEPLKDELVVFLKALQNLGKISIWQDRAIDAGSEWNQAILQAFDSADIILLLITARFIGSDFCFSKEMSRALMHHEEKTARVIPIIMTPCAWQQMPFAKLQILPTDGKPVVEWRSQDAGLDNVMRGITRVVDKLHGVQPAVDDGWGAPLSPPPNIQMAERPTEPLAEEATADPSESLSAAQKRLALFQLLSSLPGPTFDAVVYALNVPPPLMPPSIAPQGQRVSALLNWAKSPVGCGLQELEAVIKAVC